MAIAIRGTPTNGSGSQCCDATVTVTKPTGVVDGDVIIVVIDASQDACGSPSSITSPAGWTSVDSNAFTTNTRNAVFIKLASGEGASWNFTVHHVGTLPNTRWAYGCVAYSGVDQSTQQDATATAATQTSSTNLTAPTITTVTANAMVLNISCYNGTGTVTDAASTTQRVNKQVSTASVYIADELFAATGATGTRVPTIVGAKVSRGVTIALRPAASGGGASRRPDFMSFF